MKDYNELMQEYFEKLTPTLQKLDQERLAFKQKLNTVGIPVAVSLALAVGIASFIYLPHVEVWAKLIIMAVFGIGSFVLLYKYYEKGFGDKFKEEIIRPMIGFIDKELVYEPTKSFPKEVIKKANLFLRRVDKVVGDDYIYGKVDGVAVEIGDVEVITRVPKERLNDTSYHIEMIQQESPPKIAEDVTLFHGMLVRATFPKHFNSHTIITPDEDTKIFGLDMPALFKNYYNQPQKVKLDHPEFESLFNVYSDDAIEAHYLLTPAFMEKLIALNKEYNGIYAAFVEGDIFVALPQNISSLEVSAYHNIKDAKTMQQFFKPLFDALGIVATLRLNEKLWSKE